MIKLAYIAKSLAVSVIVGALYGAVAGAAFGTVLVPIAGTMFGFFFGAVGGAVFGLIGGATGGIIGWGFAGFVGGLISSSMLNSGRPVDAWSLAPAFILAAIGIGLGLAMGQENPRLPLSSWLREHHRQAALLQGFQATRVVVALLAALWGGYILHERFTAPIQPGGLMAISDD